MNRELGRRAHAILQQAMDVDPARRAGFVAAACAEDARLRTCVQELVAALDLAYGFLETPALEATHAVDAFPDTPPVERIGDYQLVRVIGVGGMATVYEAIQDKPQRRVALKVMRPGLAHTSAIHRFQYEMETLARLQHPGIAQIFEAGSWSCGDGPTTPFFAMEFIADARTVVEYARVADLSLADRLRLMAAVCDAVQHGHQLGVIHRDLKPGNILVDGAGRPKVIDFGIARSSDPAEAWITQHVDLGQLIGTLNYMSPEQCGSGDIDTRTDVYSLGVVLYELVCGRLPADLAGVPLPEALRIVREQAPPRPGALNTHARGDIEAIILKAIDKDVARRYHSADALGADIRRHLHHQTITARPPTLLYQCRLFARRNRAFVTAATTIALTIIAGAVLSTRFAYQALRESTSRRVAEAKAVAERDAAVWQLYVANVAAAMSAFQTGELQEARARLARAPAHLRGWEWRYLAGRTERSLATLTTHDDRILDLAATPNGRLLASAGHDGVVQVWNAADRTRVAVLALPERSAAFAVALSADGTKIASGSADGAVRLWDVAGGTLTRELGSHSAAVVRVSFSPQGLVAAAWLDGKACVWDAHRGTPHLDLANQPGGVHGVCFSPSGRLFATWNYAGSVRVHESETGDILQQVALDGAVECATWSADDALLAAGGAGGEVELWDVRTGAVRQHFVTPQSISSVRALALSPDGAQLATGQIDRRIQITALGDTPRVQTLLGHEEAVSGLCFSPDGESLYSTSWDNTLRIWGLSDATRTDVVRELCCDDDQILAVAFSPDSRLLASGSADHTIGLWNPQLGLSLGVLRGHNAAVSALAFAPDGAALASASYDHTVRLWSLTAGQEVATLRDHEAAVWSVVYSPDGRWLASAGDDAVIRIWDTRTLQLARRLHGHSKRVVALAFSPDSRLLASTSRDGSVRLWDVRAGESLHLLEGHTADVFAVVFSPDGRLLYSGSRDQTVRVWNAQTGACLDAIAAPGQFITSLSMSPDASRLAAGTWFGQMLIWDCATHDIVASFRAQPSTVRAVAFSPDGRWLAATSYSHTIRVFDGAMPQERRSVQAAALAWWTAAERFAARSGEVEPSILRAPEEDLRTGARDSEQEAWNRLAMLKRALCKPNPPAR